MARDTDSTSAPRGPLGWALVVLFVVWNAVMVLVALGALAEGQRVPPEPAMAAAQSAGTSLGLGGTLLLWAGGAAVLGGGAWLTRGRRDRG